ncbi:TMPRSS4 isoform 6, partial [Pongo abelii]
KVQAGSDKLGSFPSLAVAKIIIIEFNPMYPKDNDIALMKLQFPLTFSAYLNWIYNVWKAEL